LDGGGITITFGENQDAILFRVSGIYEDSTRIETSSVARVHTIVVLPRNATTAPNTISNEGELRADGKKNERVITRGVVSRRRGQDPKTNEATKRVGSTLDVEAGARVVIDVENELNQTGARVSPLSCDRNWVHAPP